MKVSQVSVQLIFARKWGLSSFERVCFLSLPRSGTQLIAKLFQQKYQTQFDIGELFESHHISTYDFDDNNNLTNINFTRNPTPTGWKLYNKDDYRLDVLQRINKNQSVSIKLFLFNHYNKTALYRIIATLKTLNFKFVALKRSLPDQLLSYIVADHWKNSLHKNVFPINRVVEGKSHVILTDGIKRICSQITESNNDFDYNLRTISASIGFYAVPIIYESIIDQCADLLKYSIMYEGVKTLDDPKLHIENYEEIKTYINSLTAF